MTSEMTPFKVALHDYEMAAMKLREATEVLPDFWEHPCDCMKPDEDGVLDWNIESIQVVEPGYVRWEQVDSVLPPGGSDEFGDGPAIHASTDGWDSMSESGAVEYLECAPERGGCGAIWAVPEELEWD